MKSQSLNYHLGIERSSSKTNAKLESSFVGKERRVSHLIRDSKLRLRQHRRISEIYVSRIEKEDSFNFQKRLENELRNVSPDITQKYHRP